MRHVRDCQKLSETEMKRLYYTCIVLVLLEIQLNNFYSHPLDVCDAIIADNDVVLWKVCHSVQLSELRRFKFSCQNCNMFLPNTKCGMKRCPSLVDTNDGLQ